MKILLVCSAGMSTSLLKELMMQECLKEGKNYTICNLDLGIIEREIENTDVVLLGPQVKHALKRLVKEYGYKIPIAVLKSEDYGTLNAKNIIYFAEKECEKFEASMKSKNTVK